MFFECIVWVYLRLELKKLVACGKHDTAEYDDIHSAMDVFWNRLSIEEQSFVDKVCLKCLDVGGWVKASYGES